MCNTKLYSYLYKCISEILILSYLITIYEFSLILCMQCEVFIEEVGDGIFKNRTIILNADPNTFCDIMQRCTSRSATAQLKNTGVYVCMYVQG